MNNDVIKIVPPAPAILDLEPGQLVERAFKIAVELATVIRAGQMYCNINGEEFVKVDGWIAMGCLLGLNPFVVDVRSLPDGGFEAIVEIRSRGGHVYAAASAICGMGRKSGGRLRRRRSRAVPWRSPAQSARHTGFHSRGLCDSPACRPHPQKTCHSSRQRSLASARSRRLPNAARTASRYSIHSPRHGRRKRGTEEIKTG